MVGGVALVAEALALLLRRVVGEPALALARVDALDALAQRAGAARERVAVGRRRAPLGAARAEVAAPARGRVMRTNLALGSVHLRVRSSVVGSTSASAHHAAHLHWPWGWPGQWSVPRAASAHQARHAWHAATGRVRAGSGVQAPWHHGWQSSKSTSKATVLEHGLGGFGWARSWHFWHPRHLHVAQCLTSALHHGWQVSKLTSSGELCLHATSGWCPLQKSQPLHLQRLQ